jgi:hypothetical protein
MQVSSLTKLNGLLSGRSDVQTCLKSVEYECPRRAIASGTFPSPIRRRLPDLNSTFSGCVLTLGPRWIRRLRELPQPSGAISS